MDIISTTEARAEISELVNRVGYGQERIGLARRGKVVAVLVSPRAVEVLEKLEMLLDSADLLESLEAIEEGESITVTELKALMSEEPAPA